MSCSAIPQLPVFFVYWLRHGFSPSDPIRAYQSAKCSSEVRRGRHRCIRSFYFEKLLLSILMPTDHIVALLFAERDKLNAAIEALQGRSSPSFRGRKETVPFPVEQRLEN